jgi:cbb3-type cytochrome oxidase subunit 3
MDLFFQHAQVLGLLFFFFIFVGIAIFTMRPSLKDYLESRAKIPLQED